MDPVLHLVDWIYEGRLLPSLPGAHSEHHAQKVNQDRGDPFMSAQHHPNHHFWIQLQRDPPLEKIKLMCQISDLKMEVRCYIVNTEGFYMMLLGCLWIHQK